MQRTSRGCRSRPIGRTDNTRDWSIKTQKCRRACDKVERERKREKERDVGIWRIKELTVTADARVQRDENRKEINVFERKYEQRGN